MLTKWKVVFLVFALAFAGIPHQARAQAVYTVGNLRFFILSNQCGGGCGTLYVLGTSGNDYIGVQRTGARQWYIAQFSPGFTTNVAGTYVNSANFDLNVVQVNAYDGNDSVILGRGAGSNPPYANYFYYYGGNGDDGVRMAETRTQLGIWDVEYQF